MPFRLKKFQIAIEAEGIPKEVSNDAARRYLQRLRKVGHVTFDRLQGFGRLRLVLTRPRLTICLQEYGIGYSPGRKAQNTETDCQLSLLGKWIS